MNLQLSAYFGNPKKFLLKNVVFILSFLIASSLGGCSLDESIVKDCGNEHPNSLWGQFLCQRKKESEAAEYKKQMRIARDAEIRKQCFLDFINVDFPDKAQEIYKFVSNDFDQDIKVISNKLTKELKLVAGTEYVKGKGSTIDFEQANGREKNDASSFKSVDFSFRSNCNVEHLVGVATVDYDNAGNLISIDIHSEWKNSEDKIVKKELKEFTHPKFGNPAKNKRLLGDNFSLISVLERRFGKYDRNEGCFYFSSRQALREKETNQILDGRESKEDIWDEDQKFCFVIDNVNLKKSAEDQELSIILAGSSIGDRAGRFYPGIISAHKFLINSNNFEEKSQSLLALGSFWTAPDHWEPIVFSKYGSIGWINRYQHCAQGCSEYVTFLVPEKNKYWVTDFKVSSWDGNEDKDNNFYKVKFDLINRNLSDRKFPLRLEMTGLEEGKPIKKSIVLEFDSIKKRYDIPENFYPSGLN